jgi:anti-sigma-K factor RskA
MNDPADLAERADEYVLGLVDVDKVAHINALMERDTRLQAAVSASRDRFLDLDLSAPPAAVSPSLWAAIEARLSDQGDAEPPAAYASDAAAARRWRRIELGAMAAALLLTVALGWSVLRPATPLVVAVLLDDDGQAVAIVEDFTGPAARVTPLVDVDVPVGRTLQVWTLPSEQTGPVSLGVLDDATTMTLRRASLPTPREDQLYEITVEPQGGSPTGLPTGRIVGKGLASRPR